MKNFMPVDHDPIIVDLEALRRTAPGVAIDLTRAPSARKEIAPQGSETNTIDMADSLAAIIALARRKIRR